MHDLAKTIREILRDNPYLRNNLPSAFWYVGEVGRDLNGKSKTGVCFLTFENNEGEIPLVKVDSKYRSVDMGDHRSFDLIETLARGTEVGTYFLEREIYEQQFKGVELPIGYSRSIKDPYRIEGQVGIGDRIISVDISYHDEIVKPKFVVSPEDVIEYNIKKIEMKRKNNQ